MNREQLRETIKQVILENRKKSVLLTEAHIEPDQQILDDFIASMSQPEGAKTIVILTAENPPVKMKDPNNPEHSWYFDNVNSQLNDTVIEWDNNQKQQELMSDLDKEGLIYTTVQGEYFGPETSFLIFGMSRTQVISLGKKYLQDAVVFGRKMKAMNLGKDDPDYQGRDPESFPEKSPEEGAKFYYNFEMINLQPNHKTGKGYNYNPSDPYSEMVEDERTMLITGANTQKKTNLFSTMDGKKFVIPFYSEKPEHSPMQHVYNPTEVPE
tara:strand:- start:99 stop:902 length:804 start_codon:yes stop_codon:yes gene_type:complete